MRKQPESPRSRNQLSLRELQVLNFAQILMERSENGVVSRGSAAVSIIYQLTNRVPTLIEQSHLERNEGVLLL